jgi:uncharacterized membrane protein (UPF0127 family)
MSVTTPPTALRVAIKNLDTGQTLAVRLHVATTRAERAVGLLGRAGLEAGDGLWISPTHGIHTCGMRFPIDVVALDLEGTVIDRIVEMKPWRIRWPRPGAVAVLELPAGCLHDSDTQLGHRLTIETTRTSDQQEGA